MLFNPFEKLPVFSFFNKLDLSLDPKKEEKAPPPPLLLLPFLFPFFSLVESIFGLCWGDPDPVLSSMVDGIADIGVIEEVLLNDDVRLDDIVILFDGVVILDEGVVIFDEGVVIFDGVVFDRVIEKINVDSTGNTDDDGDDNNGTELEEEDMEEVDIAWWDGNVVLVAKGIEFDIGTFEETGIPVVILPLEVVVDDDCFIIFCFSNSLFILFNFCNGPSIPAINELHISSNSLFTIARTCGSILKST